MRIQQFPNSNLSFCTRLNPLSWLRRITMRHLRASNLKQKPCIIVSGIIKSSFLCYLTMLLIKQKLRGVKPLLHLLTERSYQSLTDERGSLDGLYDKLQLQLG